MRVVETSKVDDSKDLKAAFVYGSYKANGDIFEEFYYNLDSMTINKVRPSGKTYTVGDEIPVNGESYSYPDDLILWFFVIKLQLRFATVWLSESEALTSTDIQMFL